jgi:hypothetical protein
LSADIRRFMDYSDKSGIFNIIHLRVWYLGCKGSEQLEHNLVVKLHRDYI